MISNPPCGAASDRFVMTVRRTRRILPWLLGMLVLVGVPAALWAVSAMGVSPEQRAVDAEPPPAKNIVLVALHRSRLFGDRDQFEGASGQIEVGYELAKTYRQPSALMVPGIGGPPGYERLPRRSPGHLGAILQQRERQFLSRLREFPRSESARRP